MPMWMRVALHEHTTVRLYFRCCGFPKPTTAKARGPVNMAGKRPLIFCVKNAFGSQVVDMLLHLIALGLNTRIRLSVHPIPE